MIDAVTVAGAINDRRPMQPPVTQCTPITRKRGGFTYGRIRADTGDAELLEQPACFIRKPTDVSGLTGDIRACTIAQH